MTQMPGRTRVIVSAFAIPRISFGLVSEYKSLHACTQDQGSRSLPSESPLRKEIPLPSPFFLRYEESRGCLRRQ
ncbi:hypothetical protein CSUI_007476 [Cystoisospora suis]|uniref:Uncharacterized protein n=1 Tax=Cystoisospora suis TaxID=483139 RepID=A0A2C6KQH2_9APIC|nr:hypothetical protein CSUI_007476 [Cystoisospora suis]